MLALLARLEEKSRRIVITAASVFLSFLVALSLSGCKNFKSLTDERLDSLVMLYYFLQLDKGHMYNVL